MYGWDSYFIIIGLLRNGRTDLGARHGGKLFFEIENYGALLNANRTYYLTRSQPPFLTSMVSRYTKQRSRPGTRTQPG